MIDKLYRARVLRTITLDRKNFHIHLKLNAASKKGKFGDIYFINMSDETTTLIGKDNTITLTGLRRNLKNRVLINYTIKGVPYDILLTIKELIYNNTSWFERMAFKLFLFTHHIEDYFHGKN